RAVCRPGLRGPAGSQTGWDLRTGRDRPGQGVGRADRDHPDQPRLTAASDNYRMCGSLRDKLAASATSPGRVAYGQVELGNNDPGGIVVHLAARAMGQAETRTAQRP